MKFLHPIFKRIKDAGASPEHKAFLEAIDNQLAELDADVALMVSEMRIKEATGGWLDAWGEWYGVTRKPGMTDDVFRDFILQEVTKPRNTIPGIVEELKRHLPENASVRVYEPYVDMFRFNVSELSGGHRIQDDKYTRHAVIDIIIDTPLPPHLASITDAVRSAGVKVYFTRENTLWGDDGLIHVRMYSLAPILGSRLLTTQMTVRPEGAFYMGESPLSDPGANISGRPHAVLDTGAVVLKKQPVMDGLALWYDFRNKNNDTPSHRTARDRSGNGRDGELVNFDYTADSGFVDGGLKFDGTGDHVRHSEDMSGIRTLEVTAVFRGNTDAGQFSYLVSTINHTAYTGMVIGIADGNSLRVYFGMGTDISYQVIGDFETGRVAHIVATIEDTTLRVYMDGALVYTYTAPAFDSTQVAGTQGLALGHYSLTYYLDRYKGTIYSVRAYERHLTHSEVLHNLAIEHPQEYSTEIGRAIIGQTLIIGG